MNLLIVTQTLDSTDPTLGFFHAWVEELATQYEQVTVICLREGSHALPANVHVRSLGKEVGTSRMTRVYRLLRVSVLERKHYDAAFVHMNQEYVLLAGWLWRLLGKPIYMWRNHYAGSWLTTLAAVQCKAVFYTSKYSYTARYRHARQMPVGIDTNTFAPVPSVERDTHNVFSLGRIAPSKRIEILIEALHLLAQKSIFVSTTICGDALPRDKEYERGLYRMVEEYGLEGQVRVIPGIPNTETPALYSRHGVFVNCSRSGMLDKTMFEAMACGTLVLASSEDLKGMLDVQHIFEDGNAHDLAKKLEALLALSPQDREARAVELQRVAGAHSLSMLAEKLRATMEEVPGR